jgi:hypothetical protein
MPSIDATGAAQRLLGFKSVTPSECLHYVWLAYGGHHFLTPGGDTAYDSWLSSADKHGPDPSPPAGVPVYFGIRADGNNKGDVTISLGGGRLAATDYPGSGLTGITTIAHRAAQTRRPYVGWAGTFGGYTLTGITSTASSGGTPITPDTPKDDDMPKNYNNHGTIFTLGETFGVIWSDPTNFSYLTNLAQWGAPIVVNLTSDQLTTIAGTARLLPYY